MDLFTPLALGELMLPVRMRLTIALLLTAVLFPLHRAAFTLDLKSLEPVMMRSFASAIFRIETFA